VPRNKPPDAGYGAVTGAQPLRTLLVQIRYSFYKPGSDPILTKNVKRGSDPVF
jgi:hypothetical protein